MPARSSSEAATAARTGSRLAVVRLLLPLGWLLAAIGYYGPWIAHATAALTLSGADMAEFVKFLPAVQDGTLAVARQLFYLPPVDEQYGKPFLVAGDLMAMFNDRPEVRATMEYFTTPESAGGFLEQGGALAAHQTATPDMYGQEIERGIAELVQDATVFRFDASDLMPVEVGAGSFWKGMTDYVSGAADLDTVVKEIDASWPEGAVGDVQEEMPAAESEYGFAVMPGGFLEMNYSFLNVGNFVLGKG